MPTEIIRDDMSDCYNEIKRLEAENVTLTQLLERRVKQIKVLNDAITKLKRIKGVNQNDKTDF